MDNKINLDDWISRYEGDLKILQKDKFTPLESVGEELKQVISKLKNYREIINSDYTTNQKRLQQNHE
jgi:hypothetical protein